MLVVFIVVLQRVAPNSSKTGGHEAPGVPARRARGPSGRFHSRGQSARRALPPVDPDPQTRPVWLVIPPPRTCPPGRCSELCWTRSRRCGRQRIGVASYGGSNAQAVRVHSVCSHVEQMAAVCPLCGRMSASTAGRGRDSRSAVPPVQPDPRVTMLAHLISR